MQTARAVARELEELGTPARAKASAWFFKTGKGEYGYGDVFFGVAVPKQRTVARRFAKLPLPELAKLLHDKTHECRLTALFILVKQYQTADGRGQEKIARFFLRHRKRVNNWDLVDSSAPYILGPYLLTRSRAILYRFARSKNLWERRIAVIATSAFIRAGQYRDTLDLAEILLRDKHDLIHKAVGWMLREVGNRSRADEERFLKKHAASMPRTMLRYAVEKFPARTRKRYLTARPR